MSSTAPATTGPTTVSPGPAPAPAAHALRWWLTGAGLLLVGLLLGLFVTTRGPQATGEYGLDVWFGDHHDAALNVLSGIVDIASGPVVAPIVLIAAALLMWRKSRLGALALAAATAVGWLSVGFGKLFIHRERPPMQVVHALSFEGSADSFPSGHVAFVSALLLGAVLALHVLRRSTRTAWLVGIPLVLVDAVMRLYAGAHYLGDVLASPFFAGGAVACLVALWATVPGGWRQAVAARLGETRA